MGVINPENIALSGSRRRRSTENIRPARQAATGTDLVSAVSITHLSVFLVVVEL